MKMKLGKLTNPKFEKSFKKLLQNKVPVKLAFRLRGIAKQIQLEVEKANETRDQIIQQYAMRNESGNLITEGNQIKLNPITIVEYYKAIKELDTLEVEVSELPINDIEWENLDLVPEDYIELEFITE